MPTFAAAGSVSVSCWAAASVDTFTFFPSTVALVIDSSAALRTIVRVALRTSIVTVSAPEKVLVCASGVTEMSYSVGTTSRGRRFAASAGAETVIARARKTADFMRHSVKKDCPALRN